MQIEFKWEGKGMTTPLMASPSEILSNPYACLIAENRIMLYNAAMLNGSLHHGGIKCPEIIQMNAAQPLFGII